MTRDIHHTVRIEAPVARVFAALTTQAGLRGWWTREAEVDGTHCTVSWSGHGWAVALDLAADADAHRVAWFCTRSNMQDTQAWEGTTMTFALHDADGGTRLEFVHAGYAESPCFDACSVGWGYFLGTSLKRYAETGRGIPYPEMQDTASLADGTA